MHRRRWVRRWAAAPALLLVLVVAMPGWAAAEGGAGGIQAQPAGVQRWIVELARPPVVEVAPRASAADGYRRQLLDDHRQVVEAMRRAGVDVEVHHAFTTLFNGLAVSFSAEHLPRVAALPGVKRVWPDLKVPRPSPVQSGASPQMDYTRDMIGAGQAHQHGYKGQGVFVAVMDTGIDYNHPDLGGGFGPGYRVITGYDFVGDTFCPDDEDTCGVDKVDDVPKPDDDPMDQHGHGTHVAGIIGASAASPAGVTGVAPEVTFGAYKVFGPAGSTFSSIMIEAMERVLADGADVLNMSIGAAYAWPDYPTAVAADNLVDAGVVVVASIGNSGATGLFSTGAPGNAAKVIGVASVDSLGPFEVNAGRVDQTGDTFGYVAMDFSPAAAGVSGVLVALPAGAQEGCAVTDFPAGVAGKIALIRRGTCTFQEKSLNAKAAGAMAAIIYNNAPGVVLGTLGSEGDYIPTVGISQAAGDLLLGLLDQHGTISVTLTEERSFEENPNAGFTSPFSSWGLTPDLALKPDLTAPGGNVRSTYPLDRGGYAYLSGTSMSSPHVAGAAALLLGADPTLTPDQVRRLLMNTSAPVAFGANLAFLEAVHRQGAGLPNVWAGLNTPVTVSPAKVSLGELQGDDAVRQVTLTLSNAGSEPVTYEIGDDLGLITDFDVFAPSLWTGGAQVSGPPSVTVPPGGTATVQITVDASHLDQHPAGDLIFGGWIVFSPTGGDAPVLRVPYAGFRGDFQSRPVLGHDAYGFLPLLDYVSETPGVIRPDQGEYVDIYFHIGIQPEYVRFTAHEAGPGGAPGDPAGVIYEDQHFIRSPDPQLVFVLSWAGELMNGGHLPSGDYVVVFETLRPGGTPDQVESWVSPVVSIRRAGPPVLTLTEPEDGLVTRMETVQVSGTAVDPGGGPVTVRVNGEEVAVGADGSFSTRVVLDEGANQITVVAANQRGLTAQETRTVYADWTAPVLQNLEPSSDVTLRWGESVVVRFTSEPGLHAAYDVIIAAPAGVNQRLQSLPGRPMTEVAPGVYEATYTAPAGVTFANAQVQFMARDAAGNTTIAAAPGRLTVQQAAPPTLVVTEPEDGFLTNQETVWVRGTATDPAGIAQVTVNGEPVPVDGAGAFETRVVLEEGENLITVTARSTLGLETTVERTVIADWTPPVLEDIEPAEDAALAWGETLAIRFSSEPGLEAAFEVNIVVPGAAAAMEPQAVPGTPMVEVEPGLYEGTYTAPEGVTFQNAQIQINARDAAGNMAIATAPGRLTVVPPPAPPTLELTEPDDGLVTNRDAVRVSGTATDERGIESVTVNGRQVPVAADGSFAVRVPLDEGENVITVTARNTAGLETTVQRTVVADWTAPVLEDMEPSADVTLQWGDTLTVRFTAEPGLEATYQIVLDGSSGTWYGADLPLPGTAMTETAPGVYEAVFTAPDGVRFTDAVVRFYARDAAGNVILATAPGRVTVVEPAGPGTGDGHGPGKPWHDRPSKPVQPGKPAPGRDPGPPQRPGKPAEPVKPGQPFMPVIPGGPGWSMRPGMPGGVRWC